MNAIFINLGGRRYLVPPLSGGEIKRLQPLAKKMLQVDIAVDQRMEAIVQAVQIFMRGSYPRLTREQIEEEVDLGNVTSIIEAIARIVPPPQNAWRWRSTLWPSCW